MFKSSRLHNFLSLFEKETNSFLLKYKISDISIFFGRLCLIDFKTLFLEKNSSLLSSFNISSD